MLAGAFAAHSLRAALSPEMMDIVETGARYHMYHGLALLAVGRLAHVHPCRSCQASGWSFLAGIVLFSGSLYVLALSGVRGWGAVTPFGGVAFLAGWGLMAVAVLAHRRDAAVPGGK